ncbi:MAG: peptidoglycan DD-metalloendopeptidase family protein [Trueperaceae bacterium]|nr:peptidoglycan DD-metalloendopeptidase family protein [Trueperaceae bacterium]
MPRRPFLALAALVAVALLLVGTVAAQVDRSEQQRLEAELAAGQRTLEARRAEIGAITRELGATEATLRARIDERDRVSRQLRELELQRDDLQAGITTLRGEVADTEARVAALEADLEAVKVRVQGLLLNLHRQRAAGYGTNLARTESFHDLAVRSHFVGLMAAQDVAIVTELDALIGELDAARTRLAGQIVELEGRREELAANARELDDAGVRLESLIAELRATEAGQRAQQRSLLEAQEALASQLDALDRALAQEVARLEAEERRLRQQAQSFVDDRARQAELEAQADATRARIDNLTAPVPSPAAGYVSPLDASVLLSRFGEGNNSFVSLRANAEGAAVRSVRAGVVFTVAPIGANDGYLVAIRHDATTTTVYTNLRPPVVVTGDAVEAGTVLGYLGGGTLIPPDVLRFYVRRTDAAGNAVFVDPGPVLGL